MHLKPNPASHLRPRPEKIFHLVANDLPFLWREVPGTELGLFKRAALRGLNTEEMVQAFVSLQEGGTYWASSKREQQE